MSVRAVIFFLSAALAVQRQVTQQRLLNADKEPQNWLTYGGNYSGQRYSPLTQINAANVNNLHMQWAFQQRSIEKFEATPIVVDGTMYVTQAPNDIFALDAVTGEIKWMYSYSPSRDSRPCCGRVNRGVAILGNTLFMATIDAHVVAVDARDGKLLWDKEVAKAASGYAMTLAPLVVKNKVIVGLAGAEFGIRGFIAALDAATGNEAWRFYTIPGKGEPGNNTWAGDSWMHGGASVWVTGTYDPETNLTFWGTGNPGPDYNSDKRGGDNLYSDSVVALDADSGKLKWYFQFTPHDDYDYDAVQVPVLANVDWPDASGKKTPRKVMLWANRNGYFYALDRATGTERWRSTSVRGEVRSAPVLSGGALIVASRKGLVAALDPATGAERWTRQLEKTAFLADPLVLESGVLYVAENGTLYRVTAPDQGAVDVLVKRG